ncbi:recombinase family protein [Clostridium sp. 29_15]|uniref:recombinase family protein n=1 Tax=Clostridium sp. 29_15 TaxID=1896982 RepID=UPI003A36EDE5
MKNIKFFSALAYCRVSTDQLEQLSSYEAQVEYYTNYINSNPEFEMAGIYEDEGISGINTKKREIQ